MANIVSPSMQDLSPYAALVFPGRVVAAPSKEGTANHLPAKPAEKSGLILVCKFSSTRVRKKRISGVVKSRMRGADAYSISKGSKPHGINRRAQVHGEP